MQWVKLYLCVVFQHKKINILKKKKINLPANWKISSTFGIWIQRSNKVGRVLKRTGLCPWYSLNYAHLYSTLGTFVPMWCVLGLRNFDKYIRITKYSVSIVSCFQYLSSENVPTLPTIVILDQVANVVFLSKDVFLRRSHIMNL